MTILKTENGGFTVHLNKLETELLRNDYQDISGSSHFAPLAHKLPTSWKLMQLLDIELKKQLLTETAK